jgi:tripartite-type tricarboxylate transporter receptor subunit TctC
MHMARSIVGAVVAWVVLVGAATPSLAQSSLAQVWPQRTVKWILPFGAGSGIDIGARMLADPLAARWGKSMVVENRPGGDGFVAISAFTAANDDHTLLYSAIGTFTIHPFVHDKLPYDASRDLLPIAKVSETIVAITVAESLKVGSLAELMELARAQPGKLNYAAAAGTSDFVFTAFLKSAGLSMTLVPYRDVVQAPNDLAEGRIQVLASSYAVVRPQAQTGKIKVLAVTNRERAPAVADIPTATEAGFPALAYEAPVGLFGPRGMPIELRERIAADIRAAAADPAFVARMAATGQVVDARGPAEFAAVIEQQRAKLGAVAEALKQKQ